MLNRQQAFIYFRNDSEDLLIYNWTYMIYHNAIEYKWILLNEEKKHKWRHLRFIYECIPHEYSINIQSIFLSSLNVGLVYWHLNCICVTINAINGLIFIFLNFLYELKKNSTKCIRNELMQKRVVKTRAKNAHFCHTFE